MFDADAVRDRLHARGAYPGVPDAWLPHLAELDAQLAAIDPGYRLAQVKVKFGGLRYYREHLPYPSCCAALMDAHPLGVNPTQEAEQAWQAAADAHDESAEHTAAQAAHDAADARMTELVDAAEAASYTW